LKQLEISVTLGTNYLIAEVGGEADFDEIDSDAELRVYLRNRLLLDREISKVLEDLKHPPHKIRIWVLL
jgi:hypothetical protein